MNYNVEKVKSRILEESCVNLDPYSAEIVAKNLETCLPSELMPLLERWVENKEYPDFEFQGMTLWLIVKFDNVSYWNALVTMATHMEHPEEIPLFLADYRKRCERSS